MNPKGASAADEVMASGPGDARYHGARPRSDCFQCSAVLGHRLVAEAAEQLAPPAYFGPGSWWERALDYLDATFEPRVAGSTRGENE